MLRLGSTITQVSVLHQEGSKPMHIEEFKLVHIWAGVNAQGLACMTPRVWLSSQLFSFYKQACMVYAPTKRVPGQWSGPALKHKHGWQHTRLAAENRKNVRPMRMGASFNWAATGAPVASSAPAAATNASIASLQRQCELTLVILMSTVHRYCTWGLQQ